MRCCACPRRHTSSRSKTLCTHSHSHGAALTHGGRGSQVRTAEDLAAIDALLIPGGESTTMALVAERTGLLVPLRAWIGSGRPVWVRGAAGCGGVGWECTVAEETGEAQGTCAGMIMISKEAQRTKDGQALLGGLHVKVSRNYFGSQVRQSGP
jgi:pyridoxal 5'-phosphate synthase pdxT subunit